MQGGDLVVELIAALVEAPMAAARHLLRDRHAEQALPAGCLDEAGGELEHVERAAGIAVGGARQQFQRGLLGLQLLAPESALAVGQCAPQERAEIFNRERAQHVHTRAREQRAHHFERRVLRGRADERERAVLEVRQEGVLLRLVEAVHLIQK